MAWNYDWNDHANYGNGIKDDNVCQAIIGKRINKFVWYCAELAICDMEWLNSVFSDGSHRIEEFQFTSDSAVYAQNGSIVTDHYLADFLQTITH